MLSGMCEKRCELPMRRGALCCVAFWLLFWNVKWATALQPVDGVNTTDMNTFSCYTYEYLALCTLQCSGIECGELSLNEVVQLFNLPPELLREGEMSFFAVSNEGEEQLVLDMCLATSRTKTEAEGTVSDQEITKEEEVECNARAVLEILRESTKSETACVAHSHRERRYLYCGNKYEMYTKSLPKGSLRLLKETDREAEAYNLKEYPNHFTPDVIALEEDLVLLSDFIERSKLFNANAFLKRIAMTIFATSDSVYSNSEILRRFQNKLYLLKDFEDIARNILLRHVVLAKLIDPLTIPHQKELVVTAKTGDPIRLIKKNDSTGGEDMFVNGVKVLDVIKAKRGYLYKIDSILSVRWNKGPTFIEYFKTTPGFSKMKMLMETMADTERIDEVGPITILALPDKAWKLPNGQPIPECAITALQRPENRKLVESIFELLTIPGKWNYNSIAKRHFLPVLSDLRDLTVTRSVSDTGASEVLIENSKIVKHDIPIFNGWVHLLGSMPLIEGVEMLPAVLWDCLNDFCNNCPKKGAIALFYVDKYGVLPGFDGYEAPPSIRPNWVCRGIENWYPAGVSPRTFKKYEDSLLYSSGDTSRTLGEKNGGTDFEYKLRRGRSKIRDRYDEIRQKDFESKARSKTVEAIAKKQQTLMNIAQRNSNRFSTVTQCFTPTSLQVNETVSL